MTKIGEIQEQLIGYTQEIVVTPIDKLRVIAIQRKPSQALIKRIKESIRKIGFITPVIAVKAEQDEYLIIDGQHRFLAAKELGLKELPCIVIPAKYMHDLMELNIEKQMSIREKTYVTLNVYRAYLKEEPSMKEDDPRIVDAIESSYYVTLGLAYESNQRLYGSAYEPILKRADRFLNTTLTEALKERERMARVVLSVDEVARKAIDRLKNIGITHSFIYGEVIAFCSPLSKTRKNVETFDEIFEKMKENIKNLAEKPEKFRHYESKETIREV